MTQYQTGIVRGLRNLQDVLSIISGEDGRLPKCKYHQRQGIVVFAAENEVDIYNVIAGLEKKGWSTKEVL
jgi:hypothetical protein